MLTMPCAVPSVALGLKVRAKSKPTIEPGPPTEITTIRTTSSHSGARPGSASTTVHARALLRDDRQHHARPAVRIAPGEDADQDA